MENTIQLKNFNGENLAFLIDNLQPLKDYKNVIYLILSDLKESSILLINQTDSTKKDLEKDDKFDWLLLHGAKFIGIHAFPKNANRVKEFHNIVKTFEDFPIGNKEFFIIE